MSEPSTLEISTKERPILFSGRMVQAILAGKKTQTRRTVKPQFEGDFIGPKTFSPSVTDRRGDMRPGPEQFGIFDSCGEWSIRCPYGCPGDRLWVRETWLPFDSDHRIADVRYAYRASTSTDGEEIRQEYIKCGRKYQWRPSIFMPREASRITLEVRNVRVERLNDIDEEDAEAEGFGLGAIIKAERFGRYMSAGQYAFASLWETINGKDSWRANPWVWVIKFKRIENAAI
jgi:hypothetical protein